MVDQEEKFAQERAKMVEEQIIARGIRDNAILQAFRAVPRELFVPVEFQKHSYRDGPIPLPGNQTISQPYVVALMISLLKLQSTDRVLEIGTGSGYAAALMSLLAAHVYTVERIPELVEFATERLDKGQFNNVTVIESDGTLGYARQAPYDAIIVAANGPRVPRSLQQQLAVNGRLVMPIGSRKKQRLVLVTKKEDGRFEQTKLTSVRFVPLIGEQGWQVKK